MDKLYLQPTLRSGVSGKVYPDTRQGREQMDRDEGREHIPNSGMEAMVVLIACAQVAARAAETIAPFVRRTGAGRMLKAQAAGMKKSIGELMQKISSAQNRTIQNNSNLVNITVTAARVPAMINIDGDDMEHICNRALEMCAFSCDCTREESKGCRLRHALEQIPLAAAAPLRSDPNQCPYAGARLEVDGNAEADA